MRSTLFFIPHEILGYPLFGIGIALAFCVISFVAWAIFQFGKGRAIDSVVGALPMWGIAAIVIAFVLPQVESTWEDGEPIGLPIRGYGVLVLTGLLSGIAISVHRGRQLGIAPDTIIGLGFWMMVTGVVGARAFFVIQKWESDFAILEYQDRFAAIFKVTEGGLVIYGGVFGGLLAAVVYCWRFQLKPLAVADLVGPGFLIGLAFGRIGCLLHGCCFGGICDAPLPSITFPHGSGPYVAQLADGSLLGLELEDHNLPAPVEEVREGSLAADRNVVAGQTVQSIRWGTEPQNKERNPAWPPEVAAAVSLDGEYFAFATQDLPAQSLPIHPSQIYSSINGFLLCLLLWALQPMPKRDGIAFCTGMILYAVSRLLLEGVRSDEGGQLGTPFSIAQLVGIFTILLCIAAIAVISRQPATRAWNWEAVK